MCTVSYYPREKGFFITQNRDEAPGRPVEGLSESNNSTYPIDSISKGTWIGVNGQGRVFSLLNGASSSDKTPEVPKASRGTIIPQVMDVVDPLSSLLLMNLEGIAPFTLVIAEPGMLDLFRWDGQEKQVESLDPLEPYIWSSATLYSPEWQKKRAQWFAAWLAGRENPDSRALRWFHNHGGEGNRHNDLVMDRGNVRTTSITQVARFGNGTRLRFKDLSTCMVEEKRLTLLPSLSLG